jgi:hypothetical protein
MLALVHEEKSHKRINRRIQQPNQPLTKNERVFVQIATLRQSSGRKWLGRSFHFNDSNFLA